MANNKTSASSENNLVNKEEVKSWFKLYSMPKSENYTQLVQIAAEGRRLAGLDPGQIDNSPGAGLNRDLDEVNLLLVNPGEGVHIGEDREIAVNINKDSGLQFINGELGLRPDFKLSLELFESFTEEQQRELYRWLIHAGEMAASQVQLPAFDLPANGNNKNLGTVVSVSGDGKTIALSGAEAKEPVYLFSHTDNGWQQQFADYISGYSGRAISLNRNGNVLAVGIENRSSDGGHGSVFVYHRLANGVWEKSAKLWLSEANVQQHFGCSVSLSADGTLLAVGAYGWGSGSLTNCGAVYLYQYDGKKWSQLGERLTLASPAQGDMFGGKLSLSADGSTLAVAATGRNGNNGEVTLFHRYGTYWQPRPPLNSLTSPSLDSSDSFGASLSLNDSGDILAVGCPGEKGNVGAVYLYLRHRNAWQAMGILREAVTAGERFGSELSLSGDGRVLVVSTPVGKDNTGVQTGAGWWFSYQDEQWITQGRLLAVDGELNHKFGAGICLSGDGNTLAIGASGWKSGEGKVYLYD
ncbi:MULTISPECIES: FG-GAP repeat protein [Photorhabdus]|nr:FG-GAP repeat protein [Photorhabdus asymbiotica]RKS56888.1 FG-GAP repeat protein [Photorhabdus asymbiotica]